MGDDERYTERDRRDDREQGGAKTEGDMALPFVAAAGCRSRLELPHKPGSEERHGTNDRACHERPSKYNVPLCGGGEDQESTEHGSNQERDRRDNRPVYEPPLGRLIVCRSRLVVFRPADHYHGRGQSDGANQTDPDGEPDQIGPSDVIHERQCSPR